MKLCLVVVLVAVSLAEAARIIRDEKYTTKYDNINIDEILASDRLVDNYYNCLMDKGRCTSEGTEIKSEYRDLWHLLSRVVALQNQRSYLNIIYMSAASNNHCHKIVEVKQCRYRPAVARRIPES